MATAGPLEKRAGHRLEEGADTGRRSCFADRGRARAACLTQPRTRAPRTWTRRETATVTRRKGRSDGAPLAAARRDHHSPGARALRGAARTRGLSRRVAMRCAADLPPVEAVQPPVGDLLGNAGASGAGGDRGMTVKRVRPLAARTPRCRTGVLPTNPATPIERPRDREPEREYPGGRGQRGRAAGGRGGRAGPGGAGGGGGGGGRVNTVHANYRPPPRRPGRPPTAALGGAP